MALSGGGKDAAQFSGTVLLLETPLGEMGEFLCSLRLFFVPVEI